MNHVSKRWFFPGAKKKRQRPTIKARTLPWRWRANHRSRLSADVQVGFFQHPAMGGGLPSGKRTKSYWKWSFIVDFPIKHGDFPVRYVNAYQRVLRLNYGLLDDTGKKWLNKLVMLMVLNYSCAFFSNIHCPTFDVNSERLNMSQLPSLTLSIVCVCLRIWYPKFCS